ncbi:hypothetical protein GCM10029992_08760 [Glycomyces albus]
MVLVDGRPVATGFGRGDIDLDPGRHLLQVQAGASGAYWPVDIKPGLFTRVTSFVSQRLDDGPPKSLMRQWFLLPTRSVPPRMGRIPTAALTVLGSVGVFAAGLWGAYLIDPEGAARLRSFCWRWPCTRCSR